MPGKKFSDEIDLTDGGIDAGLLVLSAVTPPGVELTQEEIAAVCGCSRGYIWWLEKRAKQKIKREFERRGINPELLGI